MPPKRGKQCEAIVLVLDVSAAVRDKFTDGQSFLDKSKECASMILQRKIFSESNDEVGIILFGSDETNNELAEDNFSDQYQNINVVTDWLMRPTWDMVENVIKLYPTDITNTDWLDAVIVAMQFIKSQIEAKSYSEHKIVLFSNFALDIKSQDQVDTIVESMKSLDIHLTVIGPDITTDYSECSEDSNIKKSETQIEGETLIGRIVTETEGIICTFEQAMSQLMFFEKSSTKPMPWNVQMSIRDIAKIPISGYKELAEPKKLRWTKVCAEDNSPLMMEQSYFLGDQVIDREDIIDGYRYGKTIIPYSSVDKEAMKYVSGDRSLKIMHFMKAKDIPLHLLNSYSPYYIVPQRDNQTANLRLTAMVKVMNKRQLVAITCKVYNRGNAPHYGALFPKIEDDHAYLLFVQLPFADEVNYLKLPPVSKKTPTDEQLKAIDKLIENMDLTEAFEDDDDQYAPENLINPQKHHLYQCIVKRALNPDAEIPSVPSESVINMLKPLPEFEMKAKKSVEKIKRLFPLKVVKKKLNKKGVSDVFVHDDGVETKQEQNNDTAQTTAAIQEEDITMAYLVQKTVITEVGTVNPEANFKELLARGEPFDKICEQMKNAIIKLILKARASDSISKALSALHTLRDSCATSDPAVYNNWICTLKNIVLERHATAHWEAIVQENLGLITIKESDKSSVSKEEADEFYMVKTESDTFNEYNEVDPDALLDEL